MDIGGIDPEKRIKSTERAQAPKRSEKAQAAFSSKLLEVEDLQSRELLEKMLLEVDRFAGDLGRKPNKDNLKKYRKGIGDFLDEVLRRAYRVEETLSLSPGGKTKIHLKVENVNRSLDDLADLVMRDQAESLLMLKKLDEIRGMIKDIYK